MERGGRGRGGDEVDCNCNVPTIEGSCKQGIIRKDIIRCVRTDCQEGNTLAADGGTAVSGGRIGGRISPVCLYTSLAVLSSMLPGCLGLHSGAFSRGEQ